MTPISTKHPKIPLDQLRAIIETSLDDDKAEDVVAISLKGKSDFADYMIIASGRSQRHVSSLADKLAERLRDAGFGGVYLEGKESGEWVLVDAGDIIVHIFHPETREHYNLEKMWAVEIPRAPAQPATA